MGDYAGEWLRVSSGGQDEANQRPDVTGWIDGHGYEVTKTYLVHGKSASKGEHQQMLDQMLADMRAGLITVLVVWRDDRIERRGVMHMIPLINAVREAGGRIEFVTQPHLNDLSTMAGRISLAVMAEVANAETETKKARVRIGRDRIKADGGFSGRVPWGLETAGAKYAKKVVPTEEGRELVPQVYARCIDGDSLARIAAWLDAETWPGVPFLYHRWWPRTVGAMIRNTAYRGVLTDMQGRPVGRCEPLVDAATWKRAGESLDGRPKRGPVNAETRAMLSGALFCPACEDSPMYRIAAGRGAFKSYYYRCAGRGSARKGCGNMARLDRVNAAVDRAIARYFNKPETERRLVTGNAAEIEARLEEIRYEIAQLGALDLGDEEYDARLSELRAVRDRVKDTPVVADRVDEVKTGKRWAELWKQVPVPERGPWLARKGFRVTADKAEVTVTKNGETVTVDL